MTSSLIRAGSLIKDTAKKSKAQCADVVTLPQVELARLHNEITTMLKEIRVINEHVTASLAKLSNQTQNNRNRTLNSSVYSADEPLHELVIPTTGEKIPRFPTNIAAISTMTLSQISPILAALGYPLPQDSNLDEARKLFRVEIGLSREPQYITMRI